MYNSYIQKSKCIIHIVRIVYLYVWDWSTYERNHFQLINLLKYEDYMLENLFQKIIEILLLEINCNISKSIVIY